MPLYLHNSSIFNTDNPLFNHIREISIDYVLPLLKTTIATLINIKLYTCYSMLYYIFTNIGAIASQ